MMAKARSWFLGAGCLLVILGVVIMAVLVRGLSAPALPRNMVVSLRIAGPIAEVTADDPLADLLGEEATSLRELRRALVLAAEDDRVRGLRVRIDSLGGGIATVQELRSLIQRFGAAGKWTVAYLETAGEFAPGNFVYYLASACDEVVINPQGDVNLIGLSSRTPFIRGTFDKLEIRPEFPGRGDYKTARFMYTQRDFTPAHREMMEWLLGSIMDQLVEGVGEGRGLDPDAVRNLVDRAPFLGEEAVEAGLVDRLEDWGSFTDRIGEREPGAKIVSVPSYLRRNQGVVRGPKIAVVTAVGTILRGASRENVNPLTGGTIMGSNTIAGAWRNVRKTKGVKAVVFRVDSPGGSALASEIIRQEMVRTAKDLPVVVSMSNVAGSGGYWIACGAQRIVADPATITGSIGVIAGHFNMSRFWEDKLGVTHGRLDTGANANIYGSLEDWTDEQRAVVDRLLDRIYDDFVERVSASRDMTPEAVDAIGRGRVFTGTQALDNGLIDVLGGFDAALIEAKKLAGIDPDAKVQLVEYPRVQPWWRQIIKKQRSDEVALQAAMETLERWVREGGVEVPGTVWMPPITIE
ncbi:MAG: signal peptide peptidase SppA [Acidobacteria bacterium]|nr:signal peptide peptidase SppA [Acidobacteriota bacterium]